MTISRRLAIILGVVLALSLLANIFIIGAIAGRATGPRALERGIAAGIERLVDAVPPALRAPVREQMQAHRPELVAAFMALQEARRGVAEAISADPLNQAAIAAALAETRARGQELATMLQDLIIEVVLPLPVEQRRELARNWLDRRARR